MKITTCQIKIKIKNKKKAHRSCNVVFTKMFITAVLFKKDRKLKRKWIRNKMKFGEEGKTTEESLRKHNVI